MKHLLRFTLLTAAIFVFSQASQAFVTSSLVVPSSSTTAKLTPKPSPFAGMTVKDFLALTPKKYRKLTGQKMSLSQKISLKIAQVKMRKMVKQGKVGDTFTMPQGIDSSDFNIGGFVLGLLLGIIGVLIAYLIGDRSVIKWAWIGFAVWVGIVLLVLIL